MSEKEEGTLIEGEDGLSNANPQVSEEAYEKKARKMHWAPLEEWRGDPEDWVPAKEFVQRQKLYDRIDNLKDTLRKERDEFKSELQTMSKAVMDMNETAFKRALTELKTQRALAVEDRNIEAVEALDEEIQSTTKKIEQVEKAQKQEPTKRTPEESPEFKSWRSENPWFDTNTEMRDDAIAIGVGFAGKNPGKSEKEVYDYTTQRIQKIYPEFFEKKGGRSEEEEGEQTTRRRQVANVESGSAGPRTKSTTGRGKITAADLDDQTRSVMKTLIKRNVFKEQAVKEKTTQEEIFLRQYEANLNRSR